MITPVPRRRPWKLARETVTLDQLSNGRLIFGAGLGAAEHDGGFYKVGEAMDLKVRAERLDEGLAILAGLWSGKPFSFSGQHYRVQEMTMLPPPVQSPRIPVWVPGVWTKEKSMQRALRWDGVIPQKYQSMTRLTPTEVKAMRQFIDEERKSTTPFDIIVGGSTPGFQYRYISRTMSATSRSTTSREAPCPGRSTPITVRPEASRSSIQPPFRHSASVLDPKPCTRMTGRSAALGEACRVI